MATIYDLKAPGQVSPVMYDIGSDRFFITDDDDFNKILSPSDVEDIRSEYLLTKGPSSPTTGCTAAINGTGNLTGTYYWKVTFVNSYGETDGGTGISNSLAVSSNSVILNNIPVSSDTTVTARKIYRGNNSTSNLKLVGTIQDNITNYFQDNVADASLGAQMPSVSDFLGISSKDGTLLRAMGATSTVFGFGAMVNKTGVNITAIGASALSSNTYGSQNTGVGESALKSNTIGDQNTGVGKGALGSLTGNNHYNTAVGARSMSSGTGGSYNTAIGLASGINNTGSNNTYLGAYTGYTQTSTSGTVIIGYRAGYYNTSSQTLIIDNQSRASAAVEPTLSLIHGTFASTAEAQSLRLNAPVKVLTTTVASLPSASTLGVGYKAIVTDASATTFYSIVASGGSYVVPVYSDGTNWRIG